MNNWYILFGYIFSIGVIINYQFPIVVVQFIAKFIFDVTNSNFKNSIFVTNIVEMTKPRFTNLFEVFRRIAQQGSISRKS